MRQPTLRVWRGLPGAGKTAEARFSETLLGTHCVSRDDLRRQLFGKRGGETTNDEEREVTKRQHEVVRTLLRAGYDVGIDDTNLPTKAARVWLGIAEDEGATVTWEDLRMVPLETCLERNARREHPVPEDWIKDKWERYCRNPAPNPTRPLKVDAPLTFPPYVRDETLPAAFLCDIDGTMAKNIGYRSPYDIAMAGYDVLNGAVDCVVWALRSRGYRILFTTGRHEQFRDLTVEWLQREANLRPEHYELVMRKDGDDRNDAIVKSEMLDEIGTRYYVVGVLDDRNRVVNMWRQRGLTCLQAAEGNF